MPPTLPALVLPPRVPGRIPLLGNALNLRFRPLEFTESLRQHGDVVSIRLGTKTGYFINTAPLVREALTTQYRSFDKGGPFWDIVRTVLGYGLVTSGRELHRRQRRLIQPAFHKSRLTEYATTMSDQAAAMSDAWRNGEHRNVPKEMLKLTTMTSIRSLFAAELSADAVSAIEQTFPILVAGTGKRVMTPIDVLYKLPLPSNRRWDQARRQLGQLVDGIIADYQATGVRHGDLLSTLLEARDEDTGESMSHTQIHDECMAMLTGSIETTANTLCWVWHILDSKPDIEQQVHAEIDEVLDGRPACYDDFPKLDYLRRVVTEVLRMYPPLWITTRIATSDVDLGGYRIPAGADVFFSSYALHRNPDYYPEPDRFDPDRWLPDRHGGLQRDSYLPFGAGVRQCIGNMFGLLEAVIALGTLAGQWRLRSIPGQRTRPKAEATLHPDRLDMITERRTGR